MSQTPRPESRLSELEGKMAIQDARIRELHDDTAEEFKAIRLDIKQLDERVQSGFLEIGKAFDLNANNIEAVKQAVASVKADVGRLEGKIDQLVKLLQKNES